jgi:DNA-binding LacI/PurR family transcriptional regulator
VPKPKKEAPASQPRKKSAMAADVARAAGVSSSAVSRAFTAGASISEATRRKVLQAARTLKYRPAQNTESSHLKGSYIIGVAVAELDDQYYARVVARLSDALAAYGYRILIFVTHGKTDLDPEQRELLHFRVDALILSTGDSSFGLAEECRHFGIPVILFNNVSTEVDAASVSGANFLGGRNIAAFLIAGGHRKLAFLSGVDKTSMELEREAGFNSVIAASGLPRPVRLPGFFTFEGAARATRALLSAREQPEGIFCVNDQSAIACIEIARSEFGLQPGKDFSVVGFDDVKIAAWPAFDLTTYSQPVDRMVSRMVELLRALLKGEQVRGVHEVVAGELIVRGSARLPTQGIETLGDGKRVWKSDATANAVVPARIRHSSPSES